MKRYFSVEENKDTVHVVSVEVHETKGVMGVGKKKSLRLHMHPGSNLSKGELSSTSVDVKQAPEDFVKSFCAKKGYKFIGEVIA